MENLLDALSYRNHSYSFSIRNLPIAIASFFIRAHSFPDASRLQSADAPLTSQLVEQVPPCVYTGQERILQCRAAKPAFLEEKGENLERPFPENRKGPALILAPLAERHAAHGMDEPLDIPASFETLCFRFLRRVAALPPLSPGRTAAAVMGMGYAAEKSMFPFMFGHPF